ncbi:hypothetical protein, partial [Armatimonas sp.]|uniref:hypothetical protein n=1 Tax=Armatimonas sp. TaxID=1872638 RepID=UPI00374FF98E
MLPAAPHGPRIGAHVEARALDLRLIALADVFDMGAKPGKAAVKGSLHRIQSRSLKCSLPGHVIISGDAAWKRERLLHPEKDLTTAFVLER